MPTHVYGLIGYPLSHSFSRAYFQDYFAKIGRANTHEYLNFEMKTIEGFSTLKERYPNLKGVNVTIPHKEAVVPLLDRLDPVAGRIGAVNCIRYEADGTTTGFNTDYLGFREDFTQKLRDHAWAKRAFVGELGEDQLNVALAKSRALVLGTGGASLAVLEALASLGVRTTRVSRTAGPGKVAYTAVSPEVMAEHLLIVNTTPLGMHPNVETFPLLPYPAMSARHFAYDLVYNPDVTEFLRRSAAAGTGTGNGLGMLYAQAVAGWDIWNPTDQTK